MTLIAAYDDVDPLQVLQLNLLCLGFALTPELVALIRSMDPRPLPCFALYALEGAAVVGQVGIVRLPVVSTAGAAEVGGVWAVATHPAYRRQGLAVHLLAAAHERMAAAGLRFSTLGADRDRVGHGLYRKHGYRDLYAPTMVLGRSASLSSQADVRAEPAGVARLDLADRLFERIAAGALGFARRHTPFFAMLHARRSLDAQDVWLLWRGDKPIGYAAATAAGSLLQLLGLLLVDASAAPAATAALARATGTHYFYARLDQAEHAAALAQTGLSLAPQRRGALMVKPLTASATLAEFRRLYGLEDGRFLISCMDVT
ncbi:MAG TPA: GNAT family N-acetyltransferase [Chloroflexaceae bacterium]|nr:GNAT family N-acetyltransferase [Chloroflexaceae bacterium]